MPATRQPSIVIPYCGPCNKESCQDIFVYLRPETNGILVESSMLRTIQSTPAYSKKVSLVYLANIPGDFIVANRLVEEHYGFRVFFARAGKSAFTAYMRRKFEERFAVPFDDARILGAYEAMSQLGLDWEGLFDIWVEWDDFLVVNGQSVKQIGEIFVINYDIPALLHKNNVHTDIAVMILRTSLTHAEFRDMIRDMGDVLIDHNVLAPHTPLSRAFHYSKGPFEQILDASGFLYDPQGKRVPMDKIRFYQYLLRKGLSRPEIDGVLRYPIMQFGMPDGSVTESDIFTFTRDASYHAAYEKLHAACCQYLLG